MKRLLSQGGQREGVLATGEALVGEKMPLVDEGAKERGNKASTAARGRTGPLPTFHFPLSRVSTSPGLISRSFHHSTRQYDLQATGDGA